MLQILEELSTEVVPFQGYLPWWLRGKESLRRLQETRFRSLGQEDPPGVGNGNQLQYSCLENSMDRGAWRASVHGVVKSQTQWSA